mgnify:CR=1 FL=1
MKKFLACVLSASMMLGLLAGCAGAGSSSGNAPASSGAAVSTPAVSGDNVLKIGVFEPSTGDSASGGKKEMLGMQYANSETPTVTVGGQEYQIQLVYADNGSSTDKALTAATQLVSEGVSLVLGSYGSGVSIAAGQIFADAKIPAIGCSCTNPQVTEGNDYYFRVCFIDPFQGTVMANYAFQNGAKSAAVITQLGDDYSSGLGSYFKEAFAKLGGNIVSEEQFQTNQTDFKAILTNIKAADPDIIFAPSSITTAPLIIKQARELGITATIAAGDTWENSTIIENAGADSEGVVISTFFDEAEPANDEAAAFIKGFKEYLVKEKQEDIIPAVSALGYDSYLAAIKAIEDAGSTDTTAIRDALKNVEIDGVTGNITFNETGDANKDIAFIKTIKDGRFQFLTTTTVE